MREDENDGFVKAIKSGEMKGNLAVELLYYKAGTTTSALHYCLTNWRFNTRYTNPRLTAVISIISD